MTLELTSFIIAYYKQVRPMLKGFFIILMNIFTLFAFGQENVLKESTTPPTILIKGKALDSTGNRNNVTIIRNDTLRKYAVSIPRPIENDTDSYAAAILKYRYFDKLLEDTNYVVRTKQDGSFQITVSPTDSLYFQAYRHFPKAYSVKDLLKMDSIVIRLQPEPCVPYERCNDTVPSNHYAFVGKKISVKGVAQPYYCGSVIPFDSKYEAEYVVLKTVYGCYESDTIRFTAFDHYGFPAFGKYQTVLLFVSEYCGKLYHEKYQYFDVYQTVDGRWASPGDPYKLDEYHRKDLKAQPMQFPDSVWFNISKLHPDAIKRQYPFPYFKIEGNKAIPVMGTYVEDLFTVKKEGVLKARKVFRTSSDHL